MPNRTISPRELEVELTSRLAALEPRRGSRPRRRSRGRARAKFAGVAGVTSLLVLGVAGVFADGGSFSVEVPDKFGYAADTTDDGAIVEYIGDSNTTFGSAGSGIFEAFLRTHASPGETGYNSDLKSKDFEFDEVGGAFTHSILVSEIPVVACEAVDPAFIDPAETGLCWELFADINDSNSTPLIQLTDLELYFSAVPSPTGYPFGLTPVYDFDGQIRINDVNQGSGRGDLRYSVPLEGITIPAGCEYGSSTCATYFVLYTGWGDEAGGDYSSDAGFNEWKVKRYPFLDVEKTATTTFDRDFDWTITKTVDPETASLFDGQSAEFDYDIQVTKSDPTDSNWAVSGTITIENTSDQDAVITDVTDEISGVGAASVVCGVDFPYELPEGDSLVCTYSSALPDGTSRTNTASATLIDGPVFTDDADVTFGDPTNVTDDSDSVNDTIDAGDFGPFTTSTLHEYSQTYDCSGVTYTDGVGTKEIPNTATLVDDGDSDDALVTITCYRLDVEKTATTTYDRDFDWTIEKSVDPDEVTLDPGETTSVDYDVVVTKSAAQDSGFAVSGNITITNPAPMAAALTSVTDSITGIGAVAVDCGGATSVPASSSLICTYSSALPDSTSRTNTATAVAYGVSYGDDADVTFGDPTNVTDNCADVSDTLEGDLGTICVSWTFEYSRTVGPYADCGDFTVDNTATVTEEDSEDSDSDSESVLVHVVNCGTSQLTPTGTECGQFVAGTATDLPTLQRNTAGNLSPGAFIYFAEVASAGVDTIEVAVTSDPLAAADPLAFDVKLYSVSGTGVCTNISSATGVSISIVDNVATYELGPSFNEAAYPNLVLYVKYSSPSGVALGTEYTFTTAIDGIVNASLTDTLVVVPKT